MAGCEVGLHFFYALLMVDEANATVANPEAKVIFESIFARTIGAILRAIVFEARLDRRALIGDRTSVEARGFSAREQTSEGEMSEPAKQLDNEAEAPPEPLSEAFTIGPEAYISEEYARAERDKLWAKVLSS